MGLAEHPKACIATPSEIMTAAEQIQTLSPAQILFRGLRVRMGIATGVADKTHMHELTRRMEYSGAIMDLVSIYHTMTLAACAALLRVHSHCRRTTFPAGARMQPECA